MATMVFCKFCYKWIRESNAGYAWYDPRAIGGIRYYCHECYLYKVQKRDLE